MGTEQNKNLQLLAVLENCERSVWTALTQGNMRADDEALHTDFLGVYSDGFASKTEHVQQLENGPTIKSFELSDLRLLTLGLDHALLSYRVEFLRKDKTETEAMYVSSVWKRDGAGWLNVFSQDTPTTA